MKLIALLSILAPVAALATSTPASEENMIFVNIDCNTVGQERSQIAQILADKTLQEKTAELEALRDTGSFDEEASELLLQLKVAPLNLGIRDAILEHGEYLCQKQNAV